MTDRICEGCNEKYDHYPAGGGDWYGGDWYSSCNICEWHSEDEGSSTIKQGLTHEELVAHKKKLNDLMTMLHNYNTTRNEIRIQVLMVELGEIKRELITEE